jgi:hypothetical protein
MDGGGGVTARPETLAAFGLALYRLREARRWPLRRAARQAIGLAGAYGTTVGALPGGAAEDTKEAML